VSAYLYDDHGAARLDVEVVENEHGDPLFASIVVEDDSQVASIELTPQRVHDLRLMLQAVERRFR
jgi:hypothetical protein